MHDMAEQPGLALSTKQLDKIANCFVDGMDLSLVSQIMGMEQLDIQSVIKTPEYKTRLSVASDEQYSREKVLDKGWDGLEALGVNKLINYMTQTNDPDFVLKTTAIANKAIRRKGTFTQPVTNAGDVKAVITLNCTYVSKIKEGFVIKETANEVEAVDKRSRSSVSQLKLGATMDSGGVNALFKKMSEKDKEENPNADIYDAVPVAGVHGAHDTGEFVPDSATELRTFSDDNPEARTGAIEPETKTKNESETDEAIDFGDLELNFEKETPNGT